MFREAIRFAIATSRALTVREYGDPFTHRLAQLVPGMQTRGILALMRRATNGPIRTFSRCRNF